MTYIFCIIVCFDAKKVCKYYLIYYILIYLYNFNNIGSILVWQKHARDVRDRSYTNNGGAMQASIKSVSADERLYSARILF
ncbi:hypothetical protein NUACC26_010520 [Scytonema sp. NUACC26]